MYANIVYIDFYYIPVSPMFMYMTDGQDISGLILALGNIHERYEAADTFMKMNGRAVGPLIGALMDSRWDIRGNAAWVLGNIGDARAVGPLIEALKDDVFEVRIAAAEALIRIGEPSVEPLIAALKDSDVILRKMAASILLRLCNKGHLDENRKIKISSSLRATA